MKITFTPIDTACFLLDINGYRIMTDPTLDHAGQLYYHGSGGFSRKTSEPALNIDLENIDLILLSHHQHKDNFDHKGQELARKAPLILSTRAAARALEHTTGLVPWETYHIHTPKVPGLKITATPARHHPRWVPEFLAGKVIGFIVEFDGQQNGVLYISGDTVYFKGIEETGRRYKIGTAIIHLGSVQFRYLTGFGQYTMNGKDLLKVAKVLDPQKIIPVHYKGWTHFKETEDKLKAAIANDPIVKRKTVFVPPGTTVDI